jgi:hypothetical protein
MTGAGSLAKRIASGHAFREHVMARGEYPGIASPDQFADLIDGVIANPDASRPLRHGRYAYWQQKTQTVVIVDPSHPDGGTAFRPAAGRAYYDRLP